MWCISLALLGGPWLPAAYPDEAVIGAAPFTVLFDTGTRADAALSSDQLTASSAWTLVPSESTEHVFLGDAVIANDRLAAVIRRHGDRIELYALGPDQPKLRGVLLPVTTADVGTVRDITITRNEVDGIALAVLFDASVECGLHVELSLGQIHVKTQGIGAVHGVRVNAPCRYAIMPDFFADDIVLDARSIPLDHVEQPSENLFMHLLDDGNAILMSVWQNRDQDISVRLAGTGDARELVSSEIAFGNGDAVWIALLDAPEIWHVREIAEADLGQELALDWQAPYRAIWRVDWHRNDGLTDSWEMIAESPDGSFTKPDLFEEVPEDWPGQDWWSKKGPRWRWNTVLGRYLYPAWFDKEGSAHLQPLKEVFNWSSDPDGSFHPLPKSNLWSGPAILYPIDRLAETPLDTSTTTDVVRSTLGVGPCQYILDVEGQNARFQGKPTCDVRDTLNEIYETGDQTEKRVEVEQALEDVIVFIRLIRTRIEAYRAFGQEMNTYLVLQEANNPQLAEFIHSMQAANDGIAHAIANRDEGIQSIPYAVGLVENFQENVLDYEGEDALDRCKAITDAWVDMGDNQDELVAECRVAVKVLRQKAFMAALVDPAANEIVREIRERTQAILRSPVSYEGARH